MATRRVIDCVDVVTGEKVYPVGHAQAIYMSDGKTVEEAYEKVGALNASFVETDGTADEPETPEWRAYVDAKIGDIDTILDNINGEEV